MTTLEKVKQLVEAEREFLARQYNVSQLGVFGSVVRNENTVDSDIDLLVEFTEPIGLLKFVNMENYLSNKLVNKVDLVSKSALKPNIGNRVLNEVLYI